MRANSSSGALSAGLGASVVLVSWLLFRAVRSRRRSRPQEGRWKALGHLRQIDIFPIKSAGAVEVEEADCGAEGLRASGIVDRRLLLLNDEEKIASAHVYPRMLCIESRLVGEGRVRLAASDMETLELAVDELVKAGGATEKQMKGYRIPLIECPAKYHAWCSRVVLQRESGMRLFVALDPIIEQSLFTSPYNDFVAVMAMHDKSMADLNSRLGIEKSVLHQQFRGNLLIESEEGVKAFDEDGWQWVRIGADPEEACLLRYKAPCLRCIIPNIDTKTGTRSPHFEPLKTLRKYRLRQHPEEPEMGVYFDVYRPGHVRLGDPVFVQYRDY